MDPSKARLVEGPVGRQLVGMTLPMLLGIATMMGQAFIDTWFIGQVGDRELAAYGFGFPILMIITSVAIGLGAGTSSVVARSIGSGDDGRTKRLATDSLILSFLITAVIAVIGVFTIRPLFLLLGAPEDMIPMLKVFMTILYVGVPFVVAGMVSMATMRATGDTRLPSKLMIGGAILNVVLDPILIFGFGPIPALGLYGAAFAGLIARGTVFLVGLYILVYRIDMVSFRLPHFDEIKRSWADILHVGLPAAGTNAIVPVGAALVTAMIARFGPEAVAGFGVASRIESLMLVIYYAMSSIIGPFVGQNLTALKEERIHLALKLSAWFCVGSGLAIAVILALLSDFLPGLFSDSEEVQNVTRLFLLIAPISYGAYGIVMVMNASFNGLGKPMPGVWVSLVRILVLYVPLAFLGMRYFGVTGIFVAYSAANILTGLLALVWAEKVVHAQCKSQLS